MEIFTISAITEMVIGSQGVTMANLGFERRVLAPGDEPASSKRASVIEDINGSLEKGVIAVREAVATTGKAQETVGGQRG